MMVVTRQSNFHRVSFQDSTHMSEFKTIQLGNDIQGVIGKSPDGSMSLQSVIFPTSKYSVNEATIIGYHLKTSYT